MLFTLLFCAWMLPGIIGRDPWKADEAYTVGLVLNMHETGDWVVPTLGADPFMEKPPIFFITSTVFVRLLSPVLEFHEAARGACVFYMLLTILFVALASRELNGPGTGWVAALLLLGCLGNLHTAHMLVTDNSLLTGFALAIYGLSLSLRRPWLAGFLCGTGAGLAFLSKGLLGPAVLGVTVACLPFCFKAWRTKNYLRLLGGTLIAVIPWVTIWPLVLHQQSPKLFMTWFWDNNVERFLGIGLGASDTTPVFYLKEILLLALPVLPLASWNLWRGGRAALQDAKMQLPLLCFLTILFVLSIAGQRRSNYAPPMFVPLTLVAVVALTNVGERAARMLNRVVFALVSIIAGVMWFAWSAQFTGFPARVLAGIRKLVPDYVPAFHGVIFTIALLFTLGWMALVICHRREGRFVAVHWTAGTALVYVLGMTLWLPVANENMSYRHDFTGLRDALGNNPGPICGRAVGEPQRAMLHYFAGVRVALKDIHGAADCRWIIIQGKTKRGQEPQPHDASWRQVWQGTHHTELFSLYRREP
jgi:4-amino-4-deoxy-L-arabinose transferase-like glycosyltransferase